MQEFLHVAETVLKHHGKPLRVAEMLSTAHKLGLLQFSQGKTPAQTLKARMCDDIRAKGAQSRFMRTGKGLFALRAFDEKEYDFRLAARATEKVLAFPASLLERAGWFHGVKRTHKRYHRCFLDPAATVFLPRPVAESDFRYKQVINYIIVKWEDTILRFVRGHYVTAEAMLAGQLCIGFGGHVREEDQTLFSENDSGYSAGLSRELNEELELPDGANDPDRLKTIGVLNDDSSDLGLLHFAFIHLLDLSGIHKMPLADALQKERNITGLQFIPITQLGTEFDRYEYWSKLCILHLLRRRGMQIPCAVRSTRGFQLHKHARHIAVVGSIGSGKSEACALLADEFGYMPVPTAQILQRVMRSAPLSRIGRPRFQERAHDFITSSDGPRILAEAIYNWMRSHEGCRRFAIDGIRHRSTFAELKKLLRGDLALIYVDALIDNAYAFYKEREEASVRFRAFVELLHHPVEREIAALGAFANIVVHNHSDKRAYQTALRRFLHTELGK